MSNQPDQPQPYAGTPPGYTPPEYIAPPAGPPVPQQPAPQPKPYGQAGYGQNPSGQTPDGATPQGQFAQPGYPAPQYSAPQYSEPQYSPPQYAAPQYGAPQFNAPQFNAPTYYKGGPGYVDTTSGPRGMSLASMIVGLVSLLAGVGFFMLPQIVGIILGHVALAKESPQGRPFSITGLITNYLALLIYGGLYAFFIIGLASMGFDSDSSSSGSNASFYAGF